MISRPTYAVLLAAMALLSWIVAAAAQDGEMDERLPQFAADALGAAITEIRVAPKSGIARPVTRDGEVVAYLGSTWDIAHTAGYSGQPVDIAVLIDARAVIRGALLLRQQEPVLTLGIAPERIADFVGGFAGYDLAEPLQPAGKRKAGPPDAIAGATISSSVIRDGIIRTGRAMATANRLLPGSENVAFDMTASAPVPWANLTATGAVAHLHVSAADAGKAFSAPIGDGSFIDLYVTILDPPRIGASLLGESGYSALMGSLAATDHAILIAANGLYSFKGTSWRKSGVFERVELHQEDRTIALTADAHRGLEGLEAEGAPEFREIGIFVLPAATGFDPARPFTLSLLASRDNGAGSARTARFELDYAPPSELLVPAETPLWQENWEQRMVSIGIVAMMLLTLYLILIFQNQIAQRPAFYNAIRLAYLTAVVAVLGIMIGAQLSVIHVLTFLQALRTQFSWEVFLLDPVIFIVWSWVAVALLFWGRVYCGWLCPFGALQELLGKVAQRLGVPQVAIPFALHERLWPIKYIAFLGLFAASLASITLAFKGAEIEPFKTVVTLRFMRDWPFVLYAIGLLIAGLFIERFFCRYLCPLGAALAIPARLRMFEWLKRRPQCGRECRICSVKCPVQAIHPEGQINPNECIYCLNCQTLYFDEHICPPLKARAARRQAYAAPNGEIKAP